jgi:hypothetical protein
MAPSSVALPFVIVALRRSAATTFDETSSEITASFVA